ncbi:MAG: ABC transporter permease [Desulfopila sp.]
MAGRSAYSGSGRTNSRLGFFPLLTLSAFAVPIMVGLTGTWLPAMGWLPVVGANQFSLAIFSELFSHPVFAGACRTTLLSGVGATLVALVATLWMTIATYGTWLWRLSLRALAPLLAMPHAAVAIGFAFLVAPSGWLIRLVSPELTGFTTPPDWLTVRDPYGLGLMLVLAIKEIPFLLLMSVSGLSQLDMEQIGWVGRSLGYSRFQVWMRLVVPQLYPQLRLPVLAVLAYSLSVVDVAMIVGPSLPPSLAVVVDRWFNDADVHFRLLGAAGATWLLLMTCLAAGLLLAAERLVWRLGAARLIDGRRDPAGRWWQGGMGFSLLVLLLVSLACLLVLVAWSCTDRWPFPEPLPSSYSLRFWYKGLALATGPLLTTLLVALLATGIAVVLVIGCLEHEVWLVGQGRRLDLQRLMWLIYLPLLVPQIAFLFGMQSAAVLFHVEGTLAGVVAVHLVFVLPYIFLTLAGVYRRFDLRYSQVATMLGASSLRVFFQVKLPMLAKPVAFAVATGFAVSVAQYLPTMYLGAGRFATITTETVILATGSNRRLIAVYALCQLLLPALIYGLAILLPAWFFRNRKGMQN